jgi:hypothetical protein
MLMTDVPTTFLDLIELMRSGKGTAELVANASLEDSEGILVLFKNEVSIAAEIELEDAETLDSTSRSFYRADLLDWFQETVDAYAEKMPQLSAREIAERIIKYLINDA